MRQLEASLGPLRVASLYRSRPVSPIAQPDFLNTAALARTALEPEAVLALGKALERAAGRRDGPRFGPRPLDIDLLLYGDERRDDPEMTLPHPRMRERGFVLAPLAEIAPGPAPAARRRQRRGAPGPARARGRGWSGSAGRPQAR